MTTVDFNTLLQEAKTAGQALPDADYPFVIDEARAQAASTGSPMLVCKMRITDGAHAGKKITNNFVLVVDNPNALRIFFRHMEVLGVGAEFFAALGQTDAVQALQQVAQRVLGRQGVMTLGHREWPAGSGSMQNQVNGVKPAGMPGMGVPTPGAAPTGSLPGLPGLPGMPQASAPTPIPTPMPGPAPTPPPPPTPAPPAPPAPPMPPTPNAATQPAPPPSPQTYSSQIAASLTGDGQPTQPVGLPPLPPPPPPAPAPDVPPPGAEAYAAGWATYTPEQKAAIRAHFGG